MCWSWLLVGWRGAHWRGGGVTRSSEKVKQPLTSYVDSTIRSLWPQSSQEPLFHDSTSTDTFSSSSTASSPSSHLPHTLHFLTLLPGIYLPVTAPTTHRDLPAITGLV